MHHCKIVIADDHPLFRAALKQAVSKAAKQVDIVEVSTMAELQDAASEHNDADLVLLDLTMPGASGFRPVSFAVFSSTAQLSGYTAPLPPSVRQYSFSIHVGHPSGIGNLLRQNSWIQ